MRVVISSRARSELLTIFIDGIERFGVQQAESFQRELDQKFRLIGTYPEIGALWEDESAFRKIAHFPYVIFYTVYPDYILIDRVVDGRSDFLSP